MGTAEATNTWLSFLFNILLYLLRTVFGIAGASALTVAVGGQADQDVHPSNDADGPARIRVLRPQLVSFASHSKHAKVATANDVRERAIRGLHVFAPSEALTGSECHSSEPASSSKL